MILRNGTGYFIEQTTEDNLKITRVVIDEGNTVISIADPRIRQSSIRVEIKDNGEHIPWSYLFNFNLEEIANMPLGDAKKKLWDSYRKSKTKKASLAGRR